MKELKAEYDKAKDLLLSIRIKTCVTKDHKNSVWLNPAVLGLARLEAYNAKCT